MPAGAEVELVPAREVDRFLTGQRGWMPRWRSQPLKSPEDAFKLLDAAKPHRYGMDGGENGVFRVRVHIGGKLGEAQDKSKPRAISLAIAAAVGIEPPAQS